MPVLQAAVMDIKTIPGSGCTECNFTQERQCEVTAHMKKAHNIHEDIRLILCLLQRAFSSHLHAFWRIQTTIPNAEINDEGLLALHQFSTEVRKLEQEDSCSAIGILYW